jgi:hypothetical protein
MFDLDVARFAFYRDGIQVILDGTRQRLTLKHALSRKDIKYHNEKLVRKLKWSVHRSSG